MIATFDVLMGVSLIYLEFCFYMFILYVYTRVCFVYNVSIDLPLCVCNKHVTIINDIVNIHFHIYISFHFIHLFLFLSYTHHQFYIKHYISLISNTFQTNATI